jgi:hypothetical protein
MGLYPPVYPRSAFYPVRRIMIHMVVDGTVTGIIHSKNCLMRRITTTPEKVSVGNGMSAWKEYTTQE